MHHLFPTYSHWHYPALAARVAEVARVHALDYRALTYRELLTAQQTFPRAMGQRPN